MSSLANDESQQAINGRTNTDRGLHSTHPSHGSWDHGSGTVSTTDPAPTPGTFDTYWTSSESGVVAIGGPMRPQFLPLPRMPTPTPMYDPSAQPLPSPYPGAPTPAPTEPFLNSDNGILCWFASPCGVPLPSTSTDSIRRHLVQFHTADVDMRDPRARTHCQWWTARGLCGHELFCEMLPEHVAGVHLKDTGCVCPRCGRKVSRPDALKRHLALSCPRR